MFFRRLGAIARKEFHHVTRDARTLFLVTIAPAFLLLTLAYVFSFDAEHFNLAILDQDKSDVSRQYIADLTSDGTWRITGYLTSFEEIDTWLQTGQAQAVIVIPRGTAAAVQAHRPAPLQAIVDGVDAILASQATGQLYTRTNLFASKLSTLSMAGKLQGARLYLPEIRNRTWYNPSLKSLVSMVPGLVAIVLYMPALALSLSLAREKELGSFEGLAATPVRGLEYLAGKAIAYIGFGFASTLPVTLVATLWFHVPFHGNLPSWLLLALCYFLASFGLSMVVANFAHSQQNAMLIMILVFFVPSFFLAGLILPVDTESLASRLAAYSLPVTHFIPICRGVFLKGLGISQLASPTLALLIIGGLTLTVSLGFFRKWID